MIRTAGTGCCLLWAVAALIAIPAAYFGPFALMAYAATAAALVLGIRHKLHDG